MLDELVTAGGTAVVGAMATDSWMLARTRVAELFRRRGGEERQQAIEGQLDSNARLVAEAEDGDQVRQTLLPLWQLELRSLLRRDPAAAEELRALIEEVRPAGNSESKWVQDVVVRDNAKAFLVQGGNIVNHHHSPESAPARSAEPPQREGRVEGEGTAGAAR
ncbi:MULTISPECIES: hypothetical protein [unclassified Streptomyces]|uniref:hypothetical protein n=1 Tax=Streptomyces TaxID=1883 RepID=UPI000823A6F8|nr:MULTISPECIES: hypothetical protein [unclassified Streptomyces]AWN31230.1 hypothetical protein DKG71_38755 [Streptomyces sp. NEAU-S7GS2]MYT15110.1 hypothetical protein [Streptomyces sp. SID4951]SCK19119.1 hypothetical protein YWIDRAFT_04542 [Streptomyces sp. SceaMP-e96]